MIDEAVAIAERLGGRRARRARAALADLRPRRARPTSRTRRRSHARLETLARELHQPLYSHAALAWRGEWAHLAGRLEEAERIERESLRVAEAAGASEARGFFLTQMFAVRRDQGRLGEMLEPIERLARQPGSIGVVWRAPLPLVLLQAGETERARAAYDVALAAALHGLPSSLFRLSGLVCVAEACAALGDADGADALIARLEPHADRLAQTAFSGCWGSVRRFLGLLARDRRPPRRGARPAGGRARAPHRARGADPRRGHRARSRRCIRGAARRSVGRPGTHPPQTRTTEARKPAAGWGPRDGLRGPSRAVSVCSCPPGHSQ